MQKVFIKYFLIVMLVTVVLTLLGNFIIQMRFAQNTAKHAGENIISSLSERINNNNETIKNLVDNSSENYIARARAFAEIIAQNPNIIENFDEMQRIVQVLGVDEVHVTDASGILSWGNIPTYYGLDFAATDQTRPFLPALTDKSFEMAQSPQPNGIEGKLFQYISVARQDQPGIVQVGVAPEVLDRALANNKIDVIIANFNVGKGENVLAIDRSSGVIVADSHRSWIGKNYSELGIPQDCFSLETRDAWVMLDGQLAYTVFGAYSDYIIAVSFANEKVYAEQRNQNIVALICNTLLGLAIIVAIFIILKRKIINDIEMVNHDLARITHGDLDVVISAKSTPEFAFLSQGLNEMVASLKKQMAETASKAAALEESNKNILSSLGYARRIQNNLLPDPQEFHKAFAEFCVLWEPKDVVGGDMYWVKNFTDGAVLCVCDCTGHGTPGALLTMLVVTALDTIVTSQNYKNPATIMWELDQKLTATLNATDSVTDIKDGAELAILYVSKSGEMHLASANTHLFICNGHDVETVKGQKFSIGEERLAGKEQVKTVVIPANAENRYYVVSDGLFDQIGEGSGLPFGYSRFKRCILENHALEQQEIIQKIRDAFTAYKGSEIRRDDITLVGFRTLPSTALADDAKV